MDINLIKYCIPGKQIRGTEKIKTTNETLSFYSLFSPPKYHSDMNSDCQNPVCVLGPCIAPGAEAAATADAVAVAGDVQSKIMRKRREDQRAERQVGPLRRGRLGPDYIARQVSRGHGGPAARGRTLTGRDGGGAARLRDYILSRVAGLEVASSENVRSHLTLCTARKP